MGQRQGDQTGPEERALRILVAIAAAVALTAPRPSAEKEAILAAMRYFFMAMATNNYAKVCAGRIAAFESHLERRLAP